MNRVTVFHFNELLRQTKEKIEMQGVEMTIRSARTAVHAETNFPNDRMSFLFGSAVSWHIPRVVNGGGPTFHDNRRGGQITSGTKGPKPNGIRSKHFALQKHFFNFPDFECSEILTQSGRCQNSKWYGFFNTRNVAL